MSNRRKSDSQAPEISTSSTSSDVEKQETKAAPAAAPFRETIQIAHGPNQDGLAHQAIRSHVDEDGTLRPADDDATPTTET